MDFPTYNDDKERDQWVDEFIERNVLMNQTCLVESLLKAGEYGYGDGGIEIDVLDLTFTVTGLYPVTDTMTNEECIDWLDDNGYILDDDELANFSLMELQDLVREYADENPREVFEWWLLADEWIAVKLEGIGEVIATDGWNHWWGRCCCGQAIKLDPTFYQLAFDILT